MTCRPAVRLLLGIALAVPLVSCGAGPGPLDVAAESSSAQEETSSAPPEVSSAPPTSAATSEAPAEARSEAGTESSGTAPEGTGSEETPATAPEPQPAPPPAPAPAPEPQPAPEPEPAEEGPGRPGAPYDIEAFDVEGGELSALDAIFRDRCGGKGDSTCLALDESPLVPEGPDRSVCTVDTLAFRPAAADPDGDGVENLQRGTTVVVTTECSGLEDGSGESP